MPFTIIGCYVCASLVSASRGTEYKYMTKLKTTYVIRVIFNSSIFPDRTLFYIKKKNGIKNARIDFAVVTRCVCGFFFFY